MKWEIVAGAATGVVIILLIFLVIPWVMPILMIPLGWFDRYAAWVERKVSR